MKIKSFSTSENVSRVIIALHGWTGNINSMVPVTKMLKINDTKWVIPEAPFKSSKTGFSWFNEVENNSWHYLKSVSYTHLTLPTNREV